MQTQLLISVMSASERRNDMAQQKGCLLCKRCIDAIKSRGEDIWVGRLVYSCDDAEEEEKKCDWCEEIDDLYDCRF